MSDVIDAVKEEVALAAGVSEVVAAEVIGQFLSLAEDAADADTREMLKALVACDDARCVRITAIPREHDGQKLCPSCYRDVRKAEREDERMRATHGPELPIGVSVRRGW